MAEPQLVLGLGNPGPVYAKTRHNLGFMVADLLAARAGASFKAHKKSGAEVATGRLAGRPIILGKPRSFMNESGRQVAALAKFYSVPPAGLVVIHDDLDIDFGRIRLKFGGGVAGHNGLRSVASAACSQITGTSGRSAAVKFSSTNATGSLRPGGRPMPTRTR